MFPNNIITSNLDAVADAFSREEYLWLGPAFAPRPFPLFTCQSALFLLLTLAFSWLLTDQ
jgi:hypothetical protein